MAVRRVADASVLAALLFGEDRAPIAARLLQGFELFAPTLFTYELSNVATRKARLDRSQIAMLLGALFDPLLYGIKTRPVDPSIAMTIAVEFEISAYDASYLSVALELGCPLVTFDKELQLAAQRFGIHALSK